ncbi:unnamed protein product [Choristocarpus tenellus]
MFDCTRAITEDLVNYFCSTPLYMVLNSRRAFSQRLNELREGRAEPGLRLRLAVQGGGCSGFQYHFELEDSSVSHDQDGDRDEDSDDEDLPDCMFERDGATLVVDHTSMDFVRGATVDFQEDMMRSAFAVVNNPNSENACGCGSSFAVKAFQANPAMD